MAAGNWPSRREEAGASPESICGREGARGDGLFDGDCAEKPGSPQVRPPGMHAECSGNREWRARLLARRSLGEVGCRAADGSSAQSSFANCSGVACIVQRSGSWIARSWPRSHHARTPSTCNRSGTPALPGADHGASLRDAGLPGGSPSGGERAAAWPDRSKPVRMAGSAPNAL